MKRSPAPPLIKCSQIPAIRPRPWVLGRCQRSTPGNSTTPATKIAPHPDHATYVKQSEWPARQRDVGHDQVLHIDPMRHQKPGRPEPEHRRTALDPPGHQAKKGISRCANSRTSDNRDPLVLLPRKYQVVSSGMLAYQISMYCEKAMYPQNTVKREQQLPSSW